jgi:hypothetical protein
MKFFPKDKVLLDTAGWNLHVSRGQFREKRTKWNSYLIISNRGD